MKYKLFKLLTFEEQREYRHNELQTLYSWVMLTILAIVVYGLANLGFMTTFSIFGIVLLITTCLVYFKTLSLELKFRGIAKKKQKVLKELENT